MYFFFFAVNARNKKTVTLCNFSFCCKSCKPAYTIYRKKKELHDVTVFLLRAFTAKKKITRLTAKIKKITRLDDFFVHTFTAKIKKLHDLTAKKQLPILLKMHACRRCAHLWPRSGRSAYVARAMGPPKALSLLFEGGSMAFGVCTNC